MVWRLIGKGLTLNYSIKITIENNGQHPIKVNAMAAIVNKHAPYASVANWSGSLLCYSSGHNCRYPVPSSCVDARPVPRRPYSPPIHIMTSRSSATTMSWSIEPVKVFRYKPTTPALERKATKLIYINNDILDRPTDKSPYPAATKTILQGPSKTMSTSPHFPHPLSSPMKL